MQEYEPVLAVECNSFCGSCNGDQEESGDPLETADGPVQPLLHLLVVQSNLLHVMQQFASHLMYLMILLSYTVIFCER